jgi:tryptophan-rich sensory protein
MIFFMFPKIKSWHKYLFLFQPLWIEGQEKRKRKDYIIDNCGRPKWRPPFFFFNFFFNIFIFFY